MIAASQGWPRISVIAGVGGRNYYRRLGYQLRGDGKYLVKELAPCPACHRGKEPKSFEASFFDAADRVQQASGSTRDRKIVALAVVGVAAASLAAFALARRWRSTSK